MGVVAVSPPSYAGMGVAKKFLCQDCGAIFSRRWTLVRHRQRLHEGLPESFPCEYCHQVYRTREQFNEHVKKHKPTKTFARKQHALGIVSIWERKFKNAASFDYAFSNRARIVEVLQHELLKKNVIKASIDVQCTFEKIGPNGEVADKATITLHSKYYTLFRMQKFGPFLSQCKSDIQKRMEDLTLRGSNWTLRAIHKMNISIGKVKDLLGGCEQGHRIRPCRLKRGQYIRNPPSSNDECFYACIAHYFTQSMCQKTLEAFISANINKLPEGGAVGISEIAKFENANMHLNLGVNVVMYTSNGTVYPLYCSKKRKVAHRISLLLYRSDELSDVGHYMYIVDFNKYASHHYINGANEVNYIPGFYCFNCLLRFKRKTAFKKHIELCNENQTQKVVLPEEGSYMEFNSYNKTLGLPIVLFADFECGMKPTEWCTICDDGRECPHNTNFLNQHEAFAYSLVAVDINNDIILHHTYAGDDCVKNLLEYLLDHEKMLEELFNRNLPVKCTEEEMEWFRASNVCGICALEIDPQKDVKVLHHCHYSGKMISAAHRDCNINARFHGTVVPVLFHNLSGYDGHIIIKGLHAVKSGRVEKLKIMPHNTEKVRKIDMNIFSFMDSLDFLSGSLADITKDLVASQHDFSLLRKAKLFETEEQKQCLLRKGVFPYGIVKDHMQLLEMKSLPPREAFFSDLTQTHISEEDYAHAQRVFKVFKMDDMLDFAFLYVKLDVLLLAEAFLQFRNVILKEMNLDACQFLSTPHLAFHLMLKITKVRLEYLTDIDKIMYLDRSVRGGLSFVSTRFAERDPEKNVELAYWDGRPTPTYCGTVLYYTKYIFSANNLYGWAQSQLLPTDNYRWLSKKEIEKIDWTTVDTEGEDGMICEVSRLIFFKYGKFLF